MEENAIFYTQTDDEAFVCTQQNMFLAFYLWTKIYTQNVENAIEIENSVHSAPMTWL
jgi:hypothetical protein